MKSLEYLAGLFDGEGHIGVQVQRHPQWSFGGRHHLRCQVTNTDERAIVYFQEFFGGLTLPTRIYEGRRPEYRWNIDGYAARDFLRKLRPFLGIKDRQADLALDLYRPPQGRTRSQVLTRDEVKRRERIRMEISSLNGGPKGPGVKPFFLGEGKPSRDYSWARADRNPRAKLTWEKVRAIRRRSAAGESRIRLAEEYEVDPSQIDHIVRGEQWKEPTP